MNDTELLDWASFVASKFQRNHDGWVYTRDTGGLLSLRYRSDSTGYGHWTRRIRRAFNLRKMLGRGSFLRRFRTTRRSLGDVLIGALTHVQVHLFKEKNLPDGVLNSGNIITHWEEDGEYIAVFQPRVGMKVIEFLRAEPDHPAAKAIIAEMHAVAELSWPTAEEQEAA